MALSNLRGSSMFERMQKNGGYMTGPDHPMETNPRVMANRNPEEADPNDGKGDSSKAPNYRECDDATQCCKNCAHFEDATSECELYNFTAQPFMVCDSWADAAQHAGLEEGSTPKPAGMGAMPPMSNGPGNGAGGAY